MVSRSRKRRVKIGFPKIESSRLKLTLAVAGKAAKAVTRIQKSRSLTQGEIDLAKQVFKDSIDYAKVKVHKGEYLLWVQDNQTVMTPNGEMYFPEEIYEEDFSKRRQWLFIHEMTHVWQHQLGYKVNHAGLSLSAQGGYYPNNIAYEYKHIITERNNLSDFNMEQQGSIIADYFISKHWTSDLERVLISFKNNPKNKALLPTTNDIYKTVYNKTINTSPTW
ncbi:MAG: type IV secretion protein Rhs [Neisseria zoodegmatis]|uniref:type IV secretion protein Rhs n=1 Tax=Neisseria zoodegmatis TaxID=326523 RepID=UPI0026EA2803|nr:type IV secretion protein Rhs [Neisseria zoodegmatis]MDO5069342.1 type IV secretion protein Rhs [Neisseria zoodegmatis]